MVPALDLESESHLASIDSTAAATSSALTAFMQRKSIGHSRRKQGLHSTWCRKTVCPLPSGPVRSGSVEPKTAITGTPTNVARCMVPVSLVSSKRHCRSSSISCSSVVCPIRLTQSSPIAAAICSPIAASFFVPNRIHCADDCAVIFAAASANRSGNHRLAGPYSAPGQRPIKV